MRTGEATAFEPIVAAYQENVTRVVSHDPATDLYTATRMAYAKNGRTVSYVMSESWNWTGSLLYTYYDNDLIQTITERDWMWNLIATTTFTYDARGRLTAEVRSGASAYDFAYTYDQGGNRPRKTKTQGATQYVTDYYHDTMAPTVFS